jgi:hypothetical protein
VIYDPEGLPPGWPDVAAVILVGREREIKGVRADTSHYYITSRRASATELGQFVRRHWSVENELHWSLDVTFGEDKNKTTKGPCRDEPELDPQGGLITSEAGPEQREHQLQEAQRRTR